MIDCLPLPDVIVTRHQILAAIAGPGTTFLNLFRYTG